MGTLEGIQLRLIWFGLGLIVLASATVFSVALCVGVVVTVAPSPLVVDFGSLKILVAIQGPAAFFLGLELLRFVAVAACYGLLHRELQLPLAELLLIPLFPCAKNTAWRRKKKKKEKATRDKRHPKGGMFNG